MQIPVVNPYLDCVKFPPSLHSPDNWGPATKHRCVYISKAPSLVSVTPLEWPVAFPWKSPPTLAPIGRLTGWRTNEGFWPDVWPLLHYAMKGFPWSKPLHSLSPFVSALEGTIRKSLKKLNFNKCFAAPALWIGTDSSCSELNWIVSGNVQWPNSSCDWNKVRRDRLLLNIQILEVD